MASQAFFNLFYAFLLWSLSAVVWGVMYLLVESISLENFGVEEKKKQVWGAIIACVVQGTVVNVRDWVHQRPISLTACITGVSRVLGGGGRWRGYSEKLAFHFAWKATLHSSNKAVGWISSWSLAVALCFTAVYGKRDDARALAKLLSVHLVLTFAELLLHSNLVVACFLFFPWGIAILIMDAADENVGELYVREPVDPVGSEMVLAGDP